MELREWLYGKPLGECESVTPPRDGERVEFSCTIRDYIRGRCESEQAIRLRHVDFDLLAAFPSAPIADSYGAF